MRLRLAKGRINALGFVLQNGWISKGTATIWHRSLAVAYLNSQLWNGDRSRGA